MNSSFNQHGQTIYAPSGGTGGISGAQSADGGVVTLADGDVSKAVTFNAAFTAAPAVDGRVLLPDGTSAGIEAWPIESTRTTTGVTFGFGAAVSGSGYKLSWLAVGS